MLIRIEDLPAGVVGVRASGTVTGADYDLVLVPLLEQARRAREKIELLIELSPELDAFTAGALWKDLRTALRLGPKLARTALLTDSRSIRRMVEGVAAVLPLSLRWFHLDERREAIEWLTAQAEGAGIEPRLLPDEHVLLLEAKGRLRAEDFDRIASVVDPLLERQGQLRGIVVHSPRFPRWKNLKSVLRHARFVRDHRRKIARIALVADGPAARIAPRLLGPVVEANVEHFDYDHIDEAIAWASSRT